MLKGILFDFDDTLGNRNLYAYTLYRKLIETAGHNKLSEFQVENNKHEIAKLIFDIFKIDISEGIAIWDKELWKYVSVFPGTKEILFELKKSYKLGVVTNGDAFGQRKKLEQSEIDSLFDAICISGELGCEKPSPEIFLKAAKILNIKPSECIFVGDTFHTDIVGASTAGMNVVWMKRDNNYCFLKDISVISELKEIINIL